MLEGLFDKRVLLVTGKGGVGKSTLVATLAKVAANRRKRVLVAEVSAFGDDHSQLAAMFGLRKFGRTKMRVAENIFGMILLAYVGQETFIRKTIKSKALAKAAMRSNALKQLLTTTPSSRELGILYHLLSEVKSTEHDLVIVDMPASGHALAITGLPEILLKALGDGAVSETLKEGQRMFCDSNKTAAVVVVLPESLAITEGIELKKGLEDDGVKVGAIVVNQFIEAKLPREQLVALASQLKDEDVLGAIGIGRTIACGDAVAKLKATSTIPVVDLPHVAFADIVSELTQSIEETS